MLERTDHDERTFQQWRDETAAHFEAVANRCEARASIAKPSRPMRRRAITLRKLATLLRQEQP